MMRLFSRSQTGTNHDITKEIGLSICEAFVAYDNEDYAKAVDILNPMRYKIWKIGGSNAQVRLVERAAVFRPYRNVPKFSDRQVWANSADPDQTAV